MVFLFERINDSGLWSYIKYKSRFRCFAHSFVILLCLGTIENQSCEYNLCYVLFFVIMQLVLHILEKKKSVILLQDILQLPLSLIFTRVMGIFVYWIPDFAEDFSGQFAGTTGFRIIILVVAIICTGIGTAMSINMRIVANPADGFVQALSDFNGKNAGLMKNCVDGFCLMIALCIGLAVAHQPVGVGIGTILAVFGTGRVVALFNYFCMRKMKRLAAVAE